LSNGQFSKSYEFYDGLRATFDIQFLHDIGDVIANGFLADEQCLRNVPGRFVLDQQLENFPFTVGQNGFALIAALQCVTPPCRAGKYKVKGYSQIIV